MSATVTIPVWLFVALLALAAAVVIRQLLVPGVRVLLRRRVNKVIDEVNARLHIELRPFQLTRRQVLLDRLVHDPGVMAAVDAEARARDIPRDLLQARVRRYAKEIVPAFNAYLYFRAGYWLAAKLANKLYRVRIARFDEPSFRAIDPEAAVIFVMNHRSNMDYVLVSLLVAERTALSYAVGEWARIWPLQTLIRAMGAFFVRRNSSDALYRRVLETYVHMATREGVCQAVYPEGGLSRDGRLREPRLGFLSYMLRGYDPARDRDVVFVPVAINYDRTLEDRTLLLGLDPDARPRGKAYAAATATRFILRNLALMLGSRWRRLGYASVAFGRPRSMRAYCTAHPGFGGADRERAFAAVAALATELMAEIRCSIPVLPVAVMAAVLRRAGGWLGEQALLDAAEETVGALRAAGAVIGIPRSTQRYALASGLEMLVLRRIVERSPGGDYRAREDSGNVLDYYANALPRDDGD